ncbi:hypothetical protein K8I28_00240 [bacterium]|nr:hypothetical protein [bacterium]
MFSIFRILAVMLTFGFFSNLSAAIPDLEFSESVQEVSKLYRTGRLDDAELRSLRLLNAPEKISKLERGELYKILAFVAVARDDRDRGYNLFLKALESNPQLRLDKSLTSPKILSVFDRALVEFEQMDYISDQVYQGYKFQVAGGRRSLLYPGLGQLHKGQRIRGIIYMSSATAAVAGLITSQIMVQEQENIYRDANTPQTAQDAYSDYRTMWQLRNGFGIALGSIWIASMLDGFFTAPNIAGLQNTDISFTPVKVSSGYGLQLSVQWHSCK